MIDITPFVQAVVALAATLITVFLIPWLRQQTSAQDREQLLRWVDIAVDAAQQLYHQADGAARKEYVLGFLREKGYDVDDKAVDAAIEAAVLQLHQQLEGYGHAEKS